MTIYDTNKDGEITITFDSRWRDPTLLGYKPGSPGYKLLRSLWEEAMGNEEEECAENTIWEDRHDEIGVM